MNENYIHKLSQYYVNNEFDFHDFQKVKWGSYESQLLRFNILAAIDEYFFKSKILDYGCGVGSLYGFIKENHFNGEYLGYDILPNMIEDAVLKYPDAMFKSTYDSFYPDYIVASGIFAIANENLMQYEIQKMFSICGKGVAFNSLSSWASQKEEGEFYANPIEMLNFCSNLTNKIVLRHDYLPHDFTIYMYK